MRAHPVILVLLCLGAAPSVQALPAGGPPSGVEPKVPRLARPDWGRVVGWVTDAETRRPVVGAAVEIEVEGRFPEPGTRKARGLGATDSAGRYETAAPLGKISSRLDWGRVLTMHPASLVLNPKAMMKETRIVDVAGLAVRVTHPGYKPFVGILPAAEVDPDTYRVRMEDVWLAPESSRLVSFSPDNLQQEMIEGFTVTPTVAAPGDTVKICLTARLPLDRKVRYRAFLTSNNPRLVSADLPLRLEKPTPEHPNRAVFSRQVKMELHPGEKYVELGFVLVRGPGTTLVEPETRALLQTVTRTEERQAAAEVEEGYRLEREGRLDAARQRYAAATAAAPHYFLARLFLGDVCLRLNRAADAVVAFRELVAQSPEDWDVARPRYVLALLQAGRVDDAAEQMKGADSLARRVPPQIHLYRARIAALQGRFEEADQCLTRAAQFVNIPASLQEEINLRRMQFAAAARPDDPAALLAYARVLEGAGRWDEATVEIQRALRLAPGDGWAYLDLAHSLQGSGRRAEARVPLARSLELNPNNSEAMLAWADLLRLEGENAAALETYRQLAQQQPNNVRARHGLALMLYQAGELPAARREFFAVIEKTRDKGEIQDLGIPLPWQAIYFGPKRRFVNGFSAPEGAADRSIWEALDTLDRDPQNALAWQRIGSALVQLQMPRLALDALGKALAIDPDLLEARYYRALALRQQGDGPAAMRELERLIAANPLHPHARLTLARLLTEQGDVDRAQAQILAHGRNYPDERRIALDAEAGLW